MTVISVYQRSEVVKKKKKTNLYQKDFNFDVVLTLHTSPWLSIFTNLNSNQP